MGNKSHRNRKGEYHQNKILGNIYRHTPDASGISFTEFKKRIKAEKRMQNRRKH